MKTFIGLFVLISFCASAQEESDISGSYYEHMWEKNKEKKKDMSLQNCDMSPDAKEITCGDKIYVLSGSINTASRLNSKIELKDTVNSQSQKDIKPKAKKE